MAHSVSVLLEVKVVNHREERARQLPPAGRADLLPRCHHIRLGATFAVRRKAEIGSQQERCKPDDSDLKIKFKISSNFYSLMRVVALPEQH